MDNYQLIVMPLESISDCKNRGLQALKYKFIACSFT